MYVKTLNPPSPGPKSREEYARFLEASLAEGPPGALVVLPGNLGLYLAYSFGELGGESQGFPGVYENYTRLPSSWLEEFLALHREAAAGAGVYLVPGTFALRESGEIYLASSLLSPGGDELLVHKQAFLSRLERSLGFSRGDTLEVAELGGHGGGHGNGEEDGAGTGDGTKDGHGKRAGAGVKHGNGHGDGHGHGDSDWVEAGRGTGDAAARGAGFKIGLIPGTDAFYPETGRILALKGADVVCHCGCLKAASGPWVPITGMWQQVQQNQFFCVESQLHGRIAGDAFGAPSLVHGPCEMTPGQTGILSRGENPGEAVAVHLNHAERLQVISKYSLLKLLNPAAYGPLLPAEEEEILP